jgi:hypothetical protein
MASFIIICTQVCDIRMMFFLKVFNRASIF